MTHKVMDLDPITFNKSTSSELAQYYYWIAYTIWLHTQSSRRKTLKLNEQRCLYHVIWSISFIKMELQLCLSIMNTFSKTRCIEQAKCNFIFLIIGVENILLRM